MTGAERRAEIAARLACATGGDWQRSSRYPDSAAIVSDAESGWDEPWNVESYGGHLVCESVKPHNIDFIINAPADIRWLLNQGKDDEG